MKKNYKSELKKAFSKLLDIDMCSFGMHFTLATEGNRVDEMDDKALLEALEEYLSIQELGLSLENQEEYYGED